MLCLSDGADMGKDDKEKSSSESHDTKTVECKLCHKRLHKRSLDRHMKVEHGPRVYYFCKRCSHKNNRSDNLRAHYRDCHPDKVSEVDHIESETYEEHYHAKHGGGNIARKESSRASRSPDRSRRLKSGDRVSKTPDEKRRDEESKKRRGADDKEKGQPDTKRRLKTSVAECTVSKAPDDDGPIDLTAATKIKTPREAERELPVVPRKEQLEATVMTHGHNKLPEAILELAYGVPNVSAEVEVEANRYLPDEGQQVPEQVAEIALSPTPMLWEEGDASTGVKNDEDDPAPATEKKKPIPGWPKAILPEELLPGQVAHIKETREIYMYATEGKTICGEVQREYQVLYLKPVKARKPMEDTPTAQRESRIRRLIRGDAAGDVVAGSPMTKEDLVQAMEGKVTSITETSSRSVYHNDKKLTKDKTTRTFEVDFLVGVTREH